VIDLLFAIIRLLVLGGRVLLRFALVFLFLAF
jgi:hypothetical protein